MSVYRRGDTWWVRFRTQGRHIRQSAHTSSRREAEAFERKLRAHYEKIARGDTPRRTFDEMMARFVSEHLPTLKPSGEARYTKSLRLLQPHFDGLYLDQITRAKLADFVAYRRREGVSPSTIRRDLSCLSSAFTLAISWEWADANPVKAMDKRSVKVSPPRTRYLSEDEYRALLVAAPGYLRPMIIVAVHTGLRLEEQLSMTRRQIDWQRKEVHVPVTKTDTPRTVPLSDEALDALRSLTTHLHSEYVFWHGDGRRYLRVTRGLAGACKRAGINDLRWHDLRRTCGSWLLQSGVDIFTVSRWLGHKNVSVTERAYAFLDTEALHRAAQKWSQGRCISVSGGAENRRNVVPRDGVEPPTRAFSAHCSTT